MTAFSCPDCGGGFDEPADGGDDVAGRCPWCGRGFSTLQGVADDTMSTLSKINQSVEREAFEQLHVAIRYLEDGAPVEASPHLSYAAQLMYDGTAGVACQEADS